MSYLQGYVFDSFLKTNVINSKHQNNFLPLLDRKNNSTELVQNTNTKYISIKIKYYELGMFMIHKLSSYHKMIAFVRTAFNEHVIA